MAEMAALVPSIEYQRQQVEGHLVPQGVAGSDWDLWLAEVGRRVVEDVVRNPRKYASTPGGRSIAARVLQEWESLGRGEPPTWVLEMLPGTGVALTPSAASYYRSLLASAAQHFEPSQYQALLERVPSYIYNPAHAGSIPSALEALQVQSALRGATGLVFDPYSGTYRLSRGAQTFAVGVLGDLFREGIQPTEPTTGAAQPEGVAMGQATTQSTPVVPPVPSPQTGQPSITQRIMDWLSQYLGQLGTDFRRARSLTAAFAYVAPHFTSREQFIAWVQANRDELARRYGEDVPRKWIALARDERSTPLFGRAVQ